MLSGRKILVTGPTGQVARPVVERLAAHNEVWALGRLTDRAAVAELTALGVRPWRWDMRTDDLAGLPDDFTHVLHCAVDRGDGHDFEAAVSRNAVATGRLMTHCRRATAFLFVSTGALYSGQAQDHRYTETDALSTNTPWLPTYPVGKLATEGVVRALADTLSLPTTVARLNAAYGPSGHGGLPVILYRAMLAGEPIAVPHHGQEYCSPLHTDDIADQVPLLWQVAATSPTVVNWGGDDVVGVRDLMSYVADLTGVPARFEPADVTRGMVAFDDARRRALIGGCSVDWRDGVSRTLRAHFPEAVRA